MNNTPLISIITVVYNGAATLETAIASVITQTWRPVEYIIVDGGSTDGTLALIDRYKDRIATWVSEPDKGVYDAINKGIGLATGEWLYFLGSDDRLYDTGVLQKIFGEPANLENDLLYGNVAGKSYKGLYDGPFTLEKLLYKNISHQAAFYRRTLFQRTGTYNISYKAYADWDLNIRCFIDPAIRIKHVPVTVAEFGAGGISSRHDKPFLKERLIFEWLHWLNRQDTHPLRRIGYYDRWWRLLRNASIRDAGELQPYLRGEPLPPAIHSMIRFQRVLPAGLIRIGIFSKGCMAISYLYNRLTGALS